MRRDVLPSAGEVLVAASSARRAEEKIITVNHGQIDMSLILSMHDRIMSKSKLPTHPLAMRRKELGWSQEEMAVRAGIPRSSLSAIEAGRLTPSVTAALAVASTLECSVEELFGNTGQGKQPSPQWAWKPTGTESRFWEAEVDGSRLLYPVEVLHGGLHIHDGIASGGIVSHRSYRRGSETLVLAGCDPAAGMLAQEYAALSGFRLLAFVRGGRAALELLKQGVVHVAALHRSTEEHPERNEDEVRARLGMGFRLLRAADWQAGVVLPSRDHRRSVRACMKSVRKWAARERGSAARECLDELLGRSRSYGFTVSSHAAVVEAVRGGWAEAGVCVQMCAEEAGLRFLPVRRESLDFCYPSRLDHDPRIQALVRLLRSRRYRCLVGDLPGYDVHHTGDLLSI